MSAGIESKCVTQVTGCLKTVCERRGYLGGAAKAGIVRRSSDSTATSMLRMTRRGSSCVNASQDNLVMRA